ncbi:hypothetical protein ACA910_019510 [Epithemia clementina (nom. ined.)]
MTSLSNHSSSNDVNRNQAVAASTVQQNSSSSTRMSSGVSSAAPQAHPQTQQQQQQQQQEQQQQQRPLSPSFALPQQPQVPPSPSSFAAAPSPAHPAALPPPPAHVHAHPMERVLFNLHSQCCAAALRHSSSRVRSYAERALLFLSVCGFGALLLAHVNFVHYQQRLQHQYNSYHYYHSSSHTAAAQRRSSIPSKCLQCIPGFQPYADVTHIYLLLDDKDDNNNNDGDDPRPLQRSWAYTQWPAKPVVQPSSTDSTTCSCDCLETKNEEVVHPAPIPPKTGGIEEGCIISSRDEEDHETCLKSEADSGKNCTSASLCTPQQHTNPEDKNKTFKSSDSSSSLPPTDLPPQLPPLVLYQLSYSRIKGYLLLPQPTTSGSGVHDYGVSIQHVLVSKHDSNCFGEPFLQHLIFGWIGPETVVLNWCLAWHDAISWSAGTASSTNDPWGRRRRNHVDNNGSDPNYSQEKNHYQELSPPDPNFDEYWSSPGYIYNPHTDAILELRPTPTSSSSLATNSSPQQQQRRRTTLFMDPTTSANYYSQSTTTSTSATSSGGSKTPGASSTPPPPHHNHHAEYYYTTTTISTSASFVGAMASLAGSKLSMVLKTCFLYFITTTLVSFTLRETQERMLDFTQQLQFQVRHRRPIVPLVTRHLVDNLVFVPIMVGMIFFLIEFYNGDKILAFWVLTLVWFVEVFSVVSVRTYSSRQFFPKIMFLLFALWHFYIFSFPHGFSYTALTSTVCFMMHCMLFFWHRFELPAIVLGQVNAQTPRIYHHNNTNQQPYPPQPPPPPSSEMGTNPYPMQNMGNNGPMIGNNMYNQLSPGQQQEQAQEPPFTFSHQNNMYQHSQLQQQQRQPRMPSHNNDRISSGLDATGQEQQQQPPFPTTTNRQHPAQQRSVASQTMSESLIGPLPQEHHHSSGHNNQGNFSNHLHPFPQQQRRGSISPPLVLVHRSARRSVSRSSLHRSSSQGTGLSRSSSHNHNNSNNNSHHGNGNHGHSSGSTAIGLNLSRPPSSTALSFNPNSSSLGSVMGGMELLEDDSSSYLYFMGGEIVMHQTRQPSI